MTDRLRVVLADDNYLIREGTRQLLEASGRVRVEATAEDAHHLLPLVAQHRPDAVLTDIRMPPTHRAEGIDAALAIRARHPDTGVVVLSQYLQEIYAARLFQNGSDGLAYLLKERISDLDTILAALQQVAAGGSVIDPKVVETLLAHSLSQRNSPLNRLTDRETEVLRLMAQGRSNAAIGKLLHLSDSAVDKHVTAIFTKLDLYPGPETNRRVQAVLAFLHSATP